MKTFLFDLNGTMIDDMDFHETAWYEVLNGQLGAGLSRQEVKMQMYGKTTEMLDRIFGPGRFSEADIARILDHKEGQYQAAFRPYLKLIDGLDVFLELAYRQQIPMAVCSAAPPCNVDFALDGLGIRHYFHTVLHADDVQFSKPHPEVFEKAARLIGSDPASCIVFEDNPKGVEAALRAGMKAVAITSMHEPHEFAGLSNILHFVPDYKDPFLQELLEPAGTRV